MGILLLLQICKGTKPLALSVHGLPTRKQDERRDSFVRPTSSATCRRQRLLKTAQPMQRSSAAFPNVAWKMLPGWRTRSWPSRARASGMMRIPPASPCLRLHHLPPRPAPTSTPAVRSFRSKMAAVWAGRIGVEMDASNTNTTIVKAGTRRGRVLHGISSLVMIRTPRCPPK